MHFAALQIQTKTGPSLRAGRFIRKELLILAACATAALLFAALWYAYDAVHGLGEPFLFYLGWSFYMWAVLAPLAIWLAWRYPILFTTWPRAIPFHLAVSILLAAAQLSIEAWVKWLRVDEAWPLADVLRHYLTQHIEVGFVTYWLVVGATQFYRTYDQARTRQICAAQLEARLAEAQIENLRIQLHPHFLFNTLQAAASLIHEDPDGAEDILLRLSELLRISIDEMRANEISLAREIQLVEHYIRIQQRRFGDRLRFALEISPDVAACAVPTLVLQPLVENAVRHGIGKSKESDAVTIRAFQHAQGLCLEVANLTSTLVDTPERLFLKGVGLSNTQGRLQQLYGPDHSLTLVNLQPKGVCVRISIPFRELPVDETSSARAVTI
jgi:two-component system, LytTR family, sensor kinase